MKGIGGFLLGKLKLKDLSYFLLGIIFLTLGIRIMDVSKLGISFSDAIPIRLSEIFEIPVSLSSIILGLFTLIIVSIINKVRYLRFECLITSFVLGFFIDFWMDLIPDFHVHGLFFKLSIFLIGIFILSMGVALYLQPRHYPTHPNDLMLITVSRGFKFSILKSKILIDVMYGVIAILISAPIGIGSIFHTICLGFFVDKLYIFFEKMYNDEQ